MQVLSIKVYVGNVDIYNRFRHKIHKVVNELLPNNTSIYIHGNSSCSFYKKDISIERLITDGIVVKYDCLMCEKDCPLTDSRCNDHSHRNISIAMDITILKPFKSHW